MASATAFGSTWAGSYGSASSKQEPGMGTFLNFTTITPSVQKHLQKVYITLSCCLLVVALGAYANMALNIGGFLSFLGSLGCVIGLSMTPALHDNERLRLSLLVGTAFFNGCSLGPLLEAVADLDSSIIPTAFLATSAVFAAFTGAALLARRREFLYLGGLCGSALSMLMVTRFASFLFGAHVLQFQLELYVGLLVFAGYIVFDTQVMVERASMGRPDYIRDSLQLLIDFVAVFVRILIILAKNNDKNREREERKSTKRR